MKVLHGFENNLLTEDNIYLSFDSELLTFNNYCDMFVILIASKL